MQLLAFIAIIVFLVDLISAIAKGMSDAKYEYDKRRGKYKEYNWDEVWNHRRRR